MEAEATEVAADASPDAAADLEEAAEAEGAEVRARSAWDVFDTSVTGSLAHAELRRALARPPRTKPQGMAPDRIDRLIELLDEERRGAVSFSRLYGAAAAKIKQGDEPDGDVEE